MTVAKYRAGLCAGVAVTALLCASGVSAQEAAGAASVDTVVVTGSRIIRDGTQAPTPVTVLTMDNLQQQAPLSIADTLKNLPQFMGSVTTTSNGINTDYGGNNYLNLRNLGFERGLVLLNGKRVVTTAATGGVDMNTLPEALVARTEVVTGGASAAYGSGAIAGVLNLVIDTRFTGLKTELQYGQSWRDDNRGYKASVAMGGSFADGRGHIVASAEYARSEGINQDPFERNTKRPWINTATVRIGNPAVNSTNPASATNPQFILMPDAVLVRGNEWGVIQSGPFANQQFNADGTTRPFSRGARVSGTFAQGGDGWNWVNASPLDAPYIRENLYVHGEYEVMPELTFYGEVLKAYNHANVEVNPLYTHTTFPNGFPIRSDSAWLHPSFRAQMVAANQTQILVNLVPDYPVLNRKRSETGGDTTQTTFGATGQIMGKWTWDAYYSYAQNNGFVNYGDSFVISRFLKATDAVFNPAVGGVPGVPVGAIVCRSTLTDPRNGCVPLNPLGNNVSSLEAKNYVQNDADYPSVSSQEMIEASVTGDLFELPAGPLSIAAGFHWRNQHLIRESDSISKDVNPVTGNRTGDYVSGNLTEFDGGYTIKELFGEAEVPLLANMPMFLSLSVNGAFRRTDYSTSGVVNTWKLGGSWRPFEDLRFRVTRSRDIRAPNLFEVYSGPQQGIASVVDSTFTPAQTVSVTGYTGGGGAALLPEIGDTWTYGFVYQPNWLPGFATTVDVYAIKLSGAIDGLSSQLTFDQCQAGNTALCSNIVRDPATRVITSVSSPLFNLREFRTSGVDIDVNYRTDLANLFGDTPGSLTLRMLGTYLHRYSQETLGSAPIQSAGGGNFPHWRANFSGTYSLGGLSVTWSTRMVGKTKKDATLTEIQLSPADNNVGAEFYHDLSAKYRFDVRGAQMEVFGVVSNIFEPVPPNWIAVFNGAQTNRQLYDQIGRQFRVGIRAQL